MSGHQPSISTSLLHKLSKESSKQIYLLGDFNIDLFKYLLFSTMIGGFVEF